MSGKVKFLFLALIMVEVILVLLMFFGGADVKLLNSKGLVAREERNLMITSILLMLIVALPVYVGVFVTAFKYRDNKNNKHNEGKHNKKYEIFWWLVPSVIILILAVLSYGKTHALDPYRPLNSSVKPIKIQVVSLDWKWLFIYPEEQIATVNFIEFPEKTPVNFELSSDGPMNSFWIPSLSGQIYSMTGMSTKLHVISDNTGDFKGSAAEINGKGFSGMNFTARAVTNDEYEAWLKEVKTSPYVLDKKEYERLSAPSENNPVTLYSNVDDNLFNEIMDKYMQKGGLEHHSHDE